MDRYKAYLLPGVAALVVLTYYVWRWTSSRDAVEPAPTPAAPAGKETQAAKPSRSGEPAEPAAPEPEPAAIAPAPTPSPGPAEPPEE